MRKPFFVALVLTSLASLTPSNRRFAQERAGKTGHLQVEIVDAESGLRAPARCYFVNSSGESVMPKGVITYIKLPEQHFMSSGLFQLNLPPGQYTLGVERGPEFRDVTREIDIRSNENHEERIEVSRWIRMNQRRWFSGDLHVHRALREIPSILLAEDLNLAPIITDWFSDNHLVHSGPAVPERTGAIQPIDSTHVYSIFDGEVERPGRGGAGTVDLIALEAPIVFPETYLLAPPDTFFTEQAHKRSGYVDGEKILYRDTPALMALGQIDFAGIVHNWFTRYGVIQADPAQTGMISRSKAEYGTPDGMPLWAMEIYYHFLNCGFRLPASAGSASGVLPNPVGFSRVYVHLPGTFSYRSWFQALKAGRNFVTNGPMLFLTVNGHEPGDNVKVPGSARKASTILNVHAEASSARELDRLEIIWKGRVVKTIAVGDQSFRVGADFKIGVNETGWFAARAFEKTRQTLPIPNTRPVLVQGYQPLQDIGLHGFATASAPRFAHTSPVYVQVGSDPGAEPDDAQFFLAWIDREMRGFEPLSGFRSEADRQQMLAMFRQARAVYGRIEKQVNENRGAN